MNAHKFTSKVKMDREREKERECVKLDVLRPFKQAPKHIDKHTPETKRERERTLLVIPTTYVIKSGFCFPIEYIYMSKEQEISELENVFLFSRK